MSAFQDLTGQRFGYVTVIGRAPSVWGKTRWLVRCDCGREVSISLPNLKRPNKSCGCRRSGHRRKLVGDMLLTPRRLKIRELRLRGMSQGEIADVMGITRARVAEVCRDLGLGGQYKPAGGRPGKEMPPHPKWKRKAAIRALKVRDEEGTTASYVSQELNVHPRTLSRWLQEDRQHG